MEPPQGTCALITMPGFAGTPTGSSAPVMRPSEDLTVRPECTMSRHTGSCGVVPWPSWCLTQNGSFGMSVQPQTAALMAQRGIPAATIRKVTYENALAAYGLSGVMKQQDWLNPAPIAV
jgi:hypothetical protein